MSLRQAVKRWVAANRTTAGWHVGRGQAAASASRDAAASLPVVPRGDGERERVRVEEYENVGGFNLGVEGLLEGWGLWASQACAILILRMKMGHGRRHFEERCSKSPF